MVDAVQITDAAFFESPIIFMEPVPKASVTLQNGLLGGNVWNVSGDRPSFGYTDREAQRIREYIINRGGFLYMPTHGNTEAALQPALRVLRQILPEYHLTTIPQDHEIYNSYYELNGPLRFPVRKIGSTILHHGPYRQLQGVFIDDRLAVLVDTEAMIHVMDGAVQKPFFGHYQDRNKILDEFAPAAARQLVNIVIYAVTHGNISDYSNQEVCCTETLSTPPCPTQGKALREPRPSLYGQGQARPAPSSSTCCTSTPATPNKQQ